VHVVAGVLGRWLRARARAVPLIDMDVEGMSERVHRLMQRCLSSEHVGSSTEILNEFVDRLAQPGQGV
jgi:hypothetical protein